MIPETSYDIVVVGAGPAGSTAALYAAKKGASVLLLDKKREIGSPIQCAGFLPDASEVKALLPESDLPGALKSYPDSCVLQPIKTQRIIPPNCNAKEFAVKGAVLDRRRYDQFLAGQAAEAGAELMVKTRVTKYRARLLKHQEFSENTRSGQKRLSELTVPTPLSQNPGALLRNQKQKKHP